MSPRTLSWAALLVVPFLIATPAQASTDPGLDLSTDGHTWSSTLAGPLFDEDVRIVPGGQVATELWARNSSPYRATLTVVSRDIDSSLPAGVAARDDFRLRVDGSERPGTQLRGCQVLATHVLAPGQQQRVPMSVALPATSRNISQRQALSLSLHVGIVQGERSDPCDEWGTVVPGPPDPGATPEAPEVPGSVQTDGPGVLGVLPDVFVVGVLALLFVTALRRVGSRTERRGFSWRARARSSRPAS